MIFMMIYIHVPVIDNYSGADELTDTINVTMQPAISNWHVSPQSSILVAIPMAAKVVLTKTYCW